MKVRTLRPHTNGYGAPFKKRKGSRYDHPAPQGLIAQGLVEPYDDAKTGGSKGSRKGPAATEDSDRKTRKPKGNARSDGASSSAG